MVGFSCLAKIKLFMDDDFIGMPEEKKCLLKIVFFFFLQVYLYTIADWNISVLPIERLSDCLTFHCKYKQKSKQQLILAEAKHT